MLMIFFVFELIPFWWGVGLNHPSILCFRGTEKNDSVFTVNLFYKMRADSVLLKISSVGPCASLVLSTFVDNVLEFVVWLQNLMSVVWNSYSPLLFIISAPEISPVPHCQPSSDLPSHTPLLTTARPRLSCTLTGCDHSSERGCAFHLFLLLW